jgi:xanthine dehydrogenase YagS FAD-binding subunit
MGGMMRAFDYVRIRNVDEAVRAHAASADSAYLAGGTTLLDLMKLDVQRPSGVIDVHKIPLTAIEVLGDGRVPL